MKRKLMLITLLFLYINGYCQVKSNCSIPEELHDAYDYDVSQLAVTRIFETNSPYMDSISVPEVVKDTIWAGLAAIYNAFAIPERDSIFDIYCVHITINFDCYLNCNQIIIVDVDSQYNWTSNWKNLDFITGYNELDTFLSLYGFDFWDEAIDDNYRFYLVTYKYINTKPFIDSLKQFDGINEAFDYELIFEANRIYYKLINGVKTYTFKMGWGECKWSCPNYYSWKFEVDNECNVKLIEKQHIIESEPLPEYQIRNCNITSNVRYTYISRDISFQVRPNPADDIVFITAESNRNYNISIYNMLGKRVFCNNFSKEIEISLINYKSGFYLINIYDENQQFYRNIKMIKK